MMNALDPQTPSVLSEQAVVRLEGLLPKETIAELRANFRSFRAWVAEPAFRASTPEAAVQHVVQAIGPSVQFKASLIKAFMAVPNGLSLLSKAGLEALSILAPGGSSPDLVEAATHLQQGQRIWQRLAAFHTDLSLFDDTLGPVALGEALTFGFHADNLFTVSCMASDGISGVVPPATLAALHAAAADFAKRYHRTACDLAERLAPKIDATDPFRTTSLDDLLNLPPFDGRAASVDEIHEAIRAMVDAT